jgi:hypothetical protein
MPDELQYAAFVDLMGFADGQDSLDDAEAERLARVMSGEWMLQPDLSDPAKVLYVRYAAFHSIFQKVANEFPSGPVRMSVAFSDSGFVADVFRERTIDFANTMMRRCYRERIPVRIGIGRGSVGFARFSNSFGHDTMAAEAQICGTAIVRSYRAFESKTAKGFRALLHPSAVLPNDDRPTNWGIPKLPEAEQSVSCLHELNFLQSDDDGDSHWDDFRSSIDYMRQWLNISAKALLHYDGSVRTLDRFERDLRNRFGKNDAVIRVYRHQLSDLNET